MTDDELKTVNRLHLLQVTANDYTYEGRLVSTFEKRSGQIRCVIEDDNGRLFIHNAKQLSLIHRLEQD